MIKMKISFQKIHDKLSELNVDLSEDDNEYVRFLIWTCQKLRVDLSKASYDLVHKLNVDLSKKIFLTLFKSSMWKCQMPIMDVVVRYI